MNWTIVEEQMDDSSARKHAGGKAREDISSILSDCGVERLNVVFSKANREVDSSIKKLFQHTLIAKEWKKAISMIKGGDTLILQFPAVNHTLFLHQALKQAKKNNVRLVALIHDLEIIRMSNEMDLSFRTRWRMKREEVDELELFDQIIVHNDYMKQFLSSHYHLPENKMVSLELFDYLIDDEFEPNADVSDRSSCIIAGNLLRQKSGYVYSLPDEPVFRLYGVNYEGGNRDNVDYQGSFLADELPFHMNGGFGLVWDGNSSQTCSGAWGEYLRYNNPHKTSLYLACGIPVIIWKQAALADYVSRNKVGITVESLSEINKKERSLLPEEYMMLKQNAIELSADIRQGNHTKRALRAVGII